MMSPSHSVFGSYPKKEKKSCRPRRETWYMSIFFKKGSRFDNKVKTTHNMQFLMVKKISSVLP